jgi:GNAT superfamily N-acetyltransferase
MHKEFQYLPIQPQHHQEIIKLANHVFGPGTSLLFKKHSMWGFYATDGDGIQGAVLLEKGGYKEGFLAWIFVDQRARGYRLASHLMDVGDQALSQQGLTKQFTLVRDDNTASWNLFFKRGYKVLPLWKMLFGYSLKGFFKRLNYAFALGYSVWVKDDAISQHPTYPRFPIFKAIGQAILIGFSLPLFGIRSTEFLVISLIVVPSVTILRMLIAFPIARTYGPVRFMVSQGGFILSLFLALFTSGWLPTFGFFVPKEDGWNNKAFAHQLGVQALVTWMSLNLVFIATSILVPTLFSNGFNAVLMLIIVYQMLPFFPFDSFDGAKVLRWNKGMYVVAALLSILTLVLFF